MIPLLLALLMGVAGSGWHLVAVIEPYMTVYAERQYTTRSQDNREFLIGASVQIRRQFDPPIVVDFFDSRKHTPTSVPYTAEQNQHFKARVIFPVEGELKFEWR